MSRHSDYDRSCINDYFSSIKSSYKKMTPHLGVSFSIALFFCIKILPAPDPDVLPTIRSAVKSSTDTYHFPLFQIRKHPDSDAFVHRKKILATAAHRTAEQI